MKIIPQKTIVQALKSIKIIQIKQIIHRERLRFSYEDIAFYLWVVFAHSNEQKSFKSLYITLDLKNITYQGFMKNIQLFSPLMKILFIKLNKIHEIKPSRLLNIIDSSLIIEKQAKYITQQDWGKNRVTSRPNTINKEKIRICGSKGFFVINRRKQITHVELLDINFSDQNYLKDKYMQPSKFQGILLADRGFSNKAVRERFSVNKNDIFNYDYQPCRLISPYHTSQKKNLDPKEYKLYKRRWTIETLFQKFKHNYSENILNLTGNYTRKLKEAKFYSTIIQHNLSTL